MKFLIINIFSLIIFITIQGNINQDKIYNIRKENVLLQKAGITEENRLLNDAGFYLNRFNINDSLIYVVRTESINLIQVNETGSMELISSYLIDNGEINSFTIDDTIVYLATTNGIYVLNKTEIDSFELINSSFSSNSYKRITSRNDTVYAVDQGNNIIIYDFINPLSPDSISSWYDPLGDIYDIELIDSILYLANNWGLVILNTADISNIQSLSQIASPGTSVNLFVLDTMLYIADISSGVRFINITNLLTPAEIGFYDTPDWAYDIYVQGNVGYIADDWMGLITIDLVDHSSPFILDTFSTSGYAYYISKSGDYLYLSDYSSMISFNINNPLDITEIDKISVVNYDVKEVFSDNKLLSVACNNDGIITYDISNRINPNFIFSQDTYRALDTWNDSKYVYVADYSGGLKIYNYSDSATVFLVGSCTDSVTEARRITIEGNYAYIAGGGKGMQIIDMNDKANPYQIGRYPISSGSGRKIWVQDTIACMATQSGGINIINIADMTNPTLISNIPCKVLCDDVFVEDNYLYATDADSGFVIYSIINPAIPSLVIRYKDSGYTYNRVFKLNNYLYMSSFSAIEVLDISSKANPISVGFISNRSIGIHVSDDDYIYAALGTNGLGIYSTSLTGLEEISTISKSPTYLFINRINNGEIELYFNLYKHGKVCLSLYDKSGRKIKNIINKSMSSGKHTLNLATNNILAGEYFIFGHLNELKVNAKIISF